jgi:SAM-dependent methyltransferase
MLGMTFWKRTVPPKTELAKRYLEREGRNIHLHMIHRARLRLVAKYLPKADVILDLGAAGSPLYKLGYPYPFRQLTVIDLPPDLRDNQYNKIIIPDEPGNDADQIVIRYENMIDLEGIPDNSVDLVWSGQSIEHVDLAGGGRMCKNVYRVLRKGGSFCLDTPNRYLTEIHTKPIGGGYVNPDHRHEYYTDELRRLLVDSGFRIKRSMGLCYMPFVKDEISYADFVFGSSISKDIRNSYIQYYHCTK